MVFLMYDFDIHPNSVFVFDNNVICYSRLYEFETFLGSAIRSAAFPQSS